MHETVGGTHRNDGFADGGEPYTDDEMQLMDAQERRDIAAFFDDLAATRERVDWQMAGFNMCQPIRAVPKGARLGDYAKLPICDCPVVAVAKLRATKIMRADWPISFHLSNGSKAVEMARAVELPAAFIRDVINAADGNVNVDSDGNEVPVYSQELRDRLLKAVGIAEA